MALVLSIWKLILCYKHIKNAYNCKQYNFKTKYRQTTIRSFFLKIHMYLVVLRI